MQTTTKLLGVIFLLLIYSLNLQAQACDCVCSDLGPGGLPDPLPIPGVMNAADCTTACTGAMYASSTFITFSGTCLCTGAPANPPDPTDVFEVMDAQTCADACGFLNYTTTVCTPVPVELVSFEASIQDENIVLSWKTASEIDNAGFEIERSKDGLNWQILDFVKGHGTTIEPQSYKWIDTAPLASVSYYRLKQIDNTEAFEYTKIISIALDDRKHSEVLLWPNPAHENLHFQFIDEHEYNGAMIHLYNGMGQLVKQLRPTQFNVRLNQGTLSIEDLPKGVYTLRLEQGKQLITKNFIKQ